MGVFPKKNAACYPKPSKNGLNADYDHFPIDAIAVWRVGADGQVARGNSVFTT